MSTLSDIDRKNPGFLVRRLQQVSISIFMDQLSVLGCTPIQYTILRLVGENPGSDQVNIARLAGLDTSTTMDVLVRLEARGLLRRAKGRHDQRTRLATLTKAGKTFLAAARPLVRAAQERLLLPLAKRQRAAFLNAISTLIDGHEANMQSELGKTPWRRGGAKAS